MPKSLFEPDARRTAGWSEQGSGTDHTQLLDEAPDSRLRMAIGERIYSSTLGEGILMARLFSTITDGEPVVLRVVQSERIAL
jgi:hypothetical protein